MSYYENAGQRKGGAVLARCSGERQSFEEDRGSPVRLCASGNAHVRSAALPALAAAASEGGCRPNCFTHLVSSVRTSLSHLGSAGSGAAAARLDQEACSAAAVRCCCCCWWRRRRAAQRPMQHKRPSTQHMRGQPGKCPRTIGRPLLRPVLVVKLVQHLAQRAHVRRHLRGVCGAAAHSTVHVRSARGHASLALEAG